MALGGVLFRVDAGPDAGLGHLQRCIALAAALQQLNAMCVFLTNRESAAENRVIASGWECRVLDGIELGAVGDLEATLALATRLNCDAVVVDSYHVDGDYLRNLRTAGLFVVAIDDLARYAFPCQLVVNASPHALQLPYKSSSGDTRFLLGPQYALLRPELWDVPPRKRHDTVKNILVTLGGTDSHNLMPKLVSLLDSLPGEFSVTVVIGPFFENRAEVEATARRCQRPMRIVDAPESLREIMLEADLAISAGGQTLYELVATRTPTVVLQAADNQSGSLLAIAAKGAARVAGCVGDAELLANVELAVRQLFGSRETRREMSTAAHRLGMGRGAIRVAEVFDAMRCKDWV